MKETISFLRELQRNNYREWFQAHKEEYLRIQKRFNGFVEELIREIALSDPTVAGLSAADCTYRIYRDTRFSEDKTPYKTHLGAFICPGGKKSGYSGYYFQVGTGGKGYPDAHMLATGNYCFEPEVLRILREDIVNGEGDFDRTVRQAAPAFSLDRNGALKRNPKGFPADAPYPEYLRLKAYCLWSEVDDGFLLADGLARRVAGMFRQTQPFLEYLNRAIAFARNE